MMTSTINRIALMMVAAMVTYWGCAANAAEPETVFGDARRYTVQIRTAIPIPYDTEKKGSSFGAGFVVDADRGWIVTNAHVAGRSPSVVKVSFFDREFVAVKKVYVDPFLDLAVLEVGDEIRKAKTTAAPLNCNGHPQVGHPVGAFGHPKGFKFSGTRGIVSGAAAQSDNEMLQIDASINPGNSGGPLISFVDGRVVGINTEMEKNAQNTNFALPMPYVCRVIDLLRDGKNPSPPMLPYEFLSDAEDKRTLRVVHSYATGDAPAVRAGDEIVGVVGSLNRLKNENQLVDAMRGSLDHVELRVMRGGRELVLAGRLPAEPRVVERRTLWASGVLFGILPWGIKQSPEVKFPVVGVDFVEDGSTGDFLRFDGRDFVVYADGMPVNTLEDLYLILKRCMDENRSAKFILITRSTKGKGKILEYEERALPITDLRWVSGEIMSQEETRLGPQVHDSIQDRSFLSSIRY